jgi:hypothetical protein
MTTICADAQMFADAAPVLAARRPLEPVLERLADAPLEPGAMNDVRSWVDNSYP